MKTASIADVKARLNSLLKESATQPIVVTRNGKAVALLVGVEDHEELERLLLANSKSLQSILNAADRRIEQGKGIIMIGSGEASNRRRACADRMGTANPVARGRDLTT